MTLLHSSARCGRLSDECIVFCPIIVQQRGKRFFFTHIVFKELKEVLPRSPLFLPKCPHPSNVISCTEFLPSLTKNGDYMNCSCQPMGESIFYIENLQVCIDCNLKVYSISKTVIHSFLP